MESSNSSSSPASSDYSSVELQRGINQRTPVDIFQETLKENEQFMMKVNEYIKENSADFKKEQKSQRQPVTLYEDLVFIQYLVKKDVKTQRQFLAHLETQQFQRLDQRPVGTIQRRIRLLAKVPIANIEQHINRNKPIKFNGNIYRGLPQNKTDQINQKRWQQKLLNKQHSTQFQEMEGMQQEIPEKKDSEEPKRFSRELHLQMELQLNNKIKQRLLQEIQALKAENELQKQNEAKNQEIINQLIKQAEARDKQFDQRSEQLQNVIKDRLIENEDIEKIKVKSLKEKRTQSEKRPPWKFSTRIQKPRDIKRQEQDICFQKIQRQPMDFKEISQGQISLRERKGGQKNFNQQISFTPIIRQVDQINEFQIKMEEQINESQQRSHSREQ